MTDRLDDPANWPEGMEWHAVDSDGTGYFYSDRPHQETGHQWNAAGSMRLDEKTCPNWKETLRARPQPKTRQIDWSKLSYFVREYWEPPVFPSILIPWLGGQRPLPDGLMVEFYFRQAGEQLRESGFYSWNQQGTAGDIIAFRILGVAEGWTL